MTYYEVQHYWREKWDRRITHNRLEEARRSLDFFQSCIAGRYRIVKITAEVVEETVLKHEGGKP